ncbi:retrovirus-related pol polyprotein from transposon TNT 1-94 [Tanacetum coccineum]
MKTISYGNVSDVIAGGTEGAVQQGPVRARVLNDLSAGEKERYKADIRATNILLQGIPKDIYSLINHYTDAKDIWENVKMILEGSELTKDEPGISISMMNLNTSVKFKAETIQGYILCSNKMVHAKRTTLRKRFLSTTNDPLALVSNASVQQYPTQSSKSPQSSNEPSPADNFQLDSGSSSTENLIESRTGHPLVSGLRLFKTYDGESFKGSMNILFFCGKSTSGQSDSGNDHFGAIMVVMEINVIGDSKAYCLFDINGANILKEVVSQFIHDIDDEIMKSSSDMLAVHIFKSKSCEVLPTNQILKYNMEVLHTLHMDLCGPMRVQSIKGKKYILVIVDDYSRFTWVKFLRSKDETPEFVINFLKQIQVVGIFHQKSVPRTPQQNGVVERRNHTLMEAAHTMMIFLKAPMFLWAEAVATACYTQNRSLIHTRHNKTPYELVHDKKPDLTFLRVFGALCYLQ